MIERYLVMHADLQNNSSWKEISSVLVYFKFTMCDLVLRHAAASVSHPALSHVHVKPVNESLQLEQNVHVSDQQRQ